MKANEFVKRFGLERAKQFVNADHTAHALVFATTGVSFIDLKRLVESHELIIKDFESIEMAKYEYMVSGSHSDPCWIQVKQAIADVESCQ